MIRSNRFHAILPTLVLAAFASGGAAFSAAADDTPPPSTAPGPDAGGRHHNPAWAACKKQADDQKLQAGDARRNFMKDCMKSAPNPAPAPAT
jgi:hypothetical protein